MFHAKNSGEVKVITEKRPKRFRVGDRIVWTPVVQHIKRGLVHQVIGTIVGTGPAWWMVRVRQDFTDDTIFSTSMSYLTKLGSTIAKPGATP